MKKANIFCGVMLMSVLHSYSQQEIKRCGFYEYQQALKQEDPSWEETMQLIEEQIQQYIQTHNMDAEVADIAIPVVVHVLYNTSIPSSNISDAQIYSQINKLNWDYQRLNADTVNTPSYFKNVAANTKISFCLAQRDPNGGWTNGITRTQTTKTSFSATTDDAKFNSTGGKDAWPRDKYLNIWVVPSISGGILGYATFPGGPASRDGVVIGYRYFGDRDQQSAFGTTFSLTSPYDKGRTATHEVGHWLSLYHIWGDDGTACTGSDNVSDTPNQADETYGCPNSPQISCNNGPNGDMFQNYMDYSDDICMNLFTNGQKNRMWSALNGSRVSLKTSNGCVPSAIEQYSLRNHLNIFPNPATHQAQIHANFPVKTTATIEIFNILGKRVYFYQYENIVTLDHIIDVSTFENGIYWVKLRAVGKEAIEKLLISH